MVVQFKLNGRDVAYICDPGASLLRVLRDNYNWDVKCGCEKGDCGSCTVLFDGVAVKSCVTPAAACEGHEIWTDKGLGLSDVLTQRVQAAFVECGAVQCGFCTPGMIVAAVSYLKTVGDADRKRIREGLSGNLCRCTGYNKIIDAVYKVACELKEESK